MRLGLAQINTRVGDLHGNARAVRQAVRRLDGADLILFPELCLCGYPPRDLLYDPGLTRACQALASDLAAELDGGPAVVLGSPWPGPNPIPGHPGLSNMALLLSGGRVAAAVAKRLLPVEDVFLEPRWFCPGPPSEPLLVAGVRIGLLICRDLWDEGYPVHPASELKAAGARLLLCPAASPYRAGVQERRLGHARRAGLPVVHCNLVGGNDELVFDGRSFVTDGHGRLLVELPAFEEALALCELSPTDRGEEPEAASDRPISGSGSEDHHAHKTTIIYKSNNIKLNINASKIGYKDIKSDWYENEQCLGALILGVRDFCLKNGIRDVWLGLSGGVDSAVVACIAARALGASHVHALAMPSAVTDSRSTETARELARALGLGTLTVLSIEPLLRAARDSLTSLLSGAPEEDTTVENLQARLRMLLLCAHVNRHGGLLLNTSNKTELALGYGTLYGDLAGTLSVLGDVTKPQVYALAQLLNRDAAQIPAFVLDRPPTAELRPGQVDPFDYAVVGPLCEALISPRPLPEGTPPDEVARLAGLVLAGEPKRRQAGVVLKVSDHAFGPGRLVPITRRGPFRA